MGIMILIGICCLVIIFAIIGGFIGGKYYQMQKKDQSKHDNVAYDTVINANDDQV